MKKTNSSDPRRKRPITIKWQRDGLIGELVIDGQSWGAIEWSRKRNAWCVEDAEGQCLTHESHIRGQAAARNAAIILAQMMIRDGRMPSPEEAARLLEQELAHKPTAAIRIMSRPTFLLGVNDARASRRYHADYDLWDVNTQMSYERGRQ